jgi:hypothetical protein
MQEIVTFLFLTAAAIFHQHYYLVLCIIDLSGKLGPLTSSLFLSHSRYPTAIILPSHARSIRRCLQRL